MHTGKLILAVQMVDLRMCACLEFNARLLKIEREGEQGASRWVHAKKRHDFVFLDMHSIWECILFGPWSPWLPHSFILTFVLMMRP